MLDHLKTTIAAAAATIANGEPTREERAKQRIDAELGTAGVTTFTSDASGNMTSAKSNVSKRDREKIYTALHALLNDPVYLQTEIAQIKASNSYTDYVRALQEKYKNAPASTVVTKDTKRLELGDRWVNVAPGEALTLATLKQCANDLSIAQQEYIDAVSDTTKLSQEERKPLVNALKATAPDEADYALAQTKRKQAQAAQEVDFTPASGRHY